MNFLKKSLPLWSLLVAIVVAIRFRNKVAALPLLNKIAGTGN